MKTIVLAIFFATIGGTCLAQQPSLQRGCEDSALTQAELNKCASDRAKRADDDLKAAYASLLDAASDDKAAQLKFRALERAWLRFRDAYLAAAFPASDKQLTYGSMYPMEYDDLVEEITRQQIGCVLRLLKDYAGSK